jgi:UDP-N-acetylglucosamine acyltransferase
VNTVGLQRKGFTPELIKTIKECYRIVYRKDLNVAQAVEEIRSSLPDLPEVEVFVAFVSTSTRGIIK